MKKILVLSSFMTILFSLSATASTKGYSAIRSTSGEIETNGREIIGPEEAAEQAMQAACKEAVEACEKDTRKECAVFKSESNFGLTGYVIAPADFKCWADVKDRVVSDGGQQSLWSPY